MLSRDIFSFVFVGLFLATIASSGTELRLKLLLIFESRVGLFDQTGFRFSHLLFHPRGDGHYVSEDARLLLIAAPHRPRRKTDKDMTAIGAFTSQRRSPIDLCVCARQAQTENKKTTTHL